MPHAQKYRRSLLYSGTCLLEILEPRNFLSATIGEIAISGISAESALLIGSAASPAQAPGSNSVITPSSVASASAPRRLPFDATLFYNKPLDTGMDNSLLLPSGNFAFWLVNKKLAGLGTVDDMWNDAGKLTMVAKAAWQAGYTKFCMDDEDGDLARILRNIGVIRNAVPQMKIGVFCFPQTYFNWGPDYTRSINDREAVRAIMDACDFSVPGIDLRWDMATAEGRSSWLSFLQEAVAESDRVMPGKPVYPFLPLEYNPVLKLGDLSGAELTWQEEQVAAMNLTPIIWGGWTREWKGSVIDGRAAEPATPLTPILQPTAVPAPANSKTNQARKPPSPSVMPTASSSSTPATITTSAPSPRRSASPSAGKKAVTPATPFPARHATLHRLFLPTLSRARFRAPATASDSITSGDAALKLPADDNDSPKILL